MRRFLVLLLCSAAGLARAQQADLQNAIRLYEKQEANLQSRVQAVNGKLKATDEQIESRIASILDALCSWTDSTDSGTKVMQAKEAAFEGLKRNLEALVRDRGARFAALYYPSTRISKEELAGDVRRLDARIEKRVDQVMALIASLPEEQNVQKNVWRYDGDDWNEQRNPEYTHQQRTVSRAGQLRQRAYEALKASIAKLERTRVELEQALKQMKTEEGRQFVEDMQKETNELIARRREQIKVALTNTNPSAKRLGKKSAEALLDLVNEEKKAAQRDNVEWNRLKSERDVERERLYTCQLQLAAYRRQFGAPAADTTKVQ